MQFATMLDAGSSAKPMPRVATHNPEGYRDDTAHDGIVGALRQRERELEAADERMKKLIKTIKNTIELAGFELNSRIDVTDQKTGRRYR